MFRPSTHRNARWRCGVKGSKECLCVEEKRIYGESRELGKQEAWRGREKWMCILVQCPASSGEYFPILIWACIGNPIIDANCIWLLHIKGLLPVRGIQPAGGAGCILAVEAWLLSSLGICISYLFLFTIPTFFHLNCAASLVLLSIRFNLVILKSVCWECRDFPPVIC